MGNTKCLTIGVSPLQRLVLSVSLLLAQIVLSVSLLLAQIGFTDEGKLNGVNVTVYADCGCSPNDNSLGAIFHHLDNGKAFIHTLTYMDRGH